MGARILIVEDERDIRMLMSFVLDRKGFRVEMAEDGVAGLEAIGWFKPDLVLLNIMMPRMDGFTMLRTLVESRPPKMPRVVITTGGSATFEEAFSAGAVDVVYYPFQPLRLTQAVRDALDPSLDDGQRIVRSRLRHAVSALDSQLYHWAFMALHGLRLGDLSPAQRKELRGSLLHAVNRMPTGSSSSRDAASARGRRYPGVDPRLTALALARAL